MKSNDKPIKAFISYKWEDEAHNRWVERLARDLRHGGINAVLDRWEVRLGDSFTDYMTSKIAEADVILFVITTKAVEAAESPDGKGGAVKFEIQLATARRIAGERMRLIPIYREGIKTATHVRDFRHADFRDDSQYQLKLSELIEDLHGKTQIPQVGISERQADQCDLTADNPSIPPTNHEATLSAAKKEVRSPRRKLAPVVVGGAIALSSWFGWTKISSQWKTGDLPGPAKSAATAVRAAENPVSRNKTAEEYFTDVRLTNQDGKELRLYSDLLKGKVVVINSFYTDCHSICQVTMPLFQRVQEAFPAGSGNELHFISISVDPETDTPQRLKQFAAGLNAKENWSFLTGNKTSVELALSKLGFSSENKESHSNVILIGNVSTGDFKKVHGLVGVDQMVTEVRDAIKDRR